jgi:FHS family glucose/mannose:H+ symporter-like MFS transporter
MPIPRNSSSARLSTTPESEANHLALLSGACYAGMFVFGIVMALLGAILPALAGRLRFGPSDIGALFLVMNAAMLASSLVLGLAMDRFGMKLPLVLGPVLVALSLAMFARAGAFAALRPAVLLLGIGGGALNGATNTLIADLYDDERRKSAALNLLGVFFGFGALFLPFAMGALLSHVSVERLLLAAAALCAALGGVLLLVRFPAPKQAHALPVAEMPGFLRSPLVLAFAALLFFESGVEFTLGGFVSSYLTRDMAASVRLASWVLAGYWGAIMLTRSLLSRIALAFDAYRILLLCAMGACAGAILAAAAPGLAAAAFAVVLCGASLAGIYPTALGVVGARYQLHSGTVFGILFASGLSGGILLPWLAGEMGGAAGLRSVFGMIAAAFAAIAVLSRTAAHKDRAAGSSAA